MIDYVKLEITPAVRPLGELSVEGDVGIRLAGIAQDPEFAGGDLRSLDAHVGSRRNDAQDRRGEYLQSYASSPR
jgi:hypothetical protein